MTVRRADLPGHLDLIATAPDGIRKLRGLILELAVRGKLVPQDPNDEPASELLKRIAKERARLEAGATRKKIEQTPLSAPRDWPFDLPNGWEWERFGNIAEIERGGSPRPIKSFLTNDPDGLNWIKIGDTDIGGKYITSTNEKIRREGLTKTRMVYPGDFLLTNSMSFGRPYITQIEGCIHDGWLRISPPNSLNKDYLYTLLSSPFVRKLFVIAAAGAVVMNLNADKVRELPIPLPPLAEQHRIVAKVDELMALCDWLEAEQADAETAHARLVATLLGTLTQSADAAELAAHWQRVAEHFATLFTSESSLDALKQTILQLAVMGKLVPQDPNDEPASELLKRIAQERARLEAKGACKKILVSLPVAEGELPFSAPKEWTWRRLDELLAISGGVTLGRKLADRNAVSRPYLRVANVQRGKLLLDHMKSLEVPAVELAKYRLESGDLLITEGGDWDKVGRTAIWRGEIPECLHQNHVFRARPLSAEWCSRWTEMYLNSAPARAYFAASSKQTTNLASINMTQLKSCPFPVPPLPEQHRIVTKVDQLLALVDRLKADLAESRALQERLATTLIDSARQAA